MNQDFLTIQYVRVGTKKSALDKYVNILKSTMCRECRNRMNKPFRIPLVSVVEEPVQFYPSFVRMIFWGFLSYPPFCLEHHLKLWTSSWMSKNKCNRFNNVKKYILKDIKSLKPKDIKNKMWLKHMKMNF